MKYKEIDTQKYKQMKLRIELHKRIKMLAAKKGMTVNDYLEQLIDNDNE